VLLTEYNAHVHFYDKALHSRPLMDCK
jgi:hypothetical protein